jgi:hypothetical protein
VTEPRRRTPRRWLVAAAAPVLAATLIGAPAAPASAEETNWEPTASPGRVAWGYLDRAVPDGVALDPAGDLPYGTTADAAALHVTRSYLTFDVAALRGTHILEATLAVEETQANDCTRRSVEVWAVDGPLHESSRWSGDSPADLFRVAAAGAPTSGCLVTDARFDVTRAVAWAENNDRDTVTLSVRVTAAREEDRRYGRRIANDPTLAVRYNTPPPRPVDPHTWGSGCAGAAPGSTVEHAPFSVWADLPEDADGPQDERVGRFEVWPVADESQRRTVDATAVEGRVSILSDQVDLPLVDNTPYAWRVRAYDGTDLSPWSKTCHFTVDVTDPSAPTVTSTQFPDPTVPAGDVGTPALFTVTANDPDVVSFAWTVNWGEHIVKADRPGGSATISYVPQDSGEQWIRVLAIDRAGRRSPDAAVYRFTVRESRPTVTSEQYPVGAANGGIGVPGVFVFTATQPGATRFLYRLNDDPQVSMPVPSGRISSALITPTVGGLNTLRVRTRDAAGNLGPWRVHPFTVRTEPIVVAEPDVIVGRPTTVRFQPGMPGVVAYEYWWNGEEADKQVVAAGADGTATVTYVPDYRRSPYRFTVRSRTADGAVSARSENYLWVDEATPEITGPDRGRPGEPLAFAVSSPMPDVTEYRVQVNDGEWQVVPADAAGVGHLTWTPTEDGFSWIYAYATNATGAQTARASFYLTISSAPVVASDDYPQWMYSGGVGVEGVFTVTPAMPDVVEYTYVFDRWDAAGEPVTVPAAADGTLTIRFTPTHPDYHYLKVRSRSADGFVSEWVEYNFGVA